MNISSLLCSGLLACSALSAFAADTITGRAHNRTTGKPAAGDEVVLLRLENGMEEEARSKTDSQGGFVLPVTGGARYLVRVLHRGVNYDKSVDGKGPLDIEVFDAVARIRDLQASL